MVGGLTQLSAAAIASFPFVCVLAVSIRNGKPLYCGKLRVSVYPTGALKAGQTAHWEANGAVSSTVRKYKCGAAGTWGPRKCNLG